MDNTQKLRGYVIHNYPGHVVTANCHNFAVEYPGTGEWKQYTGASAYDQVLHDLFEAGLESAYYHVRDYWGQTCNGPGAHTCGA